MDLCFVLMPFKPQLDAIYEVIKTAAEKSGLQTRRADKIQQSGLVMDQILDQIKKADVVIADLTAGNPNVFYELGIAHLIKESHQVLLLAQNDEDVPFDLKPRRYLRYKTDKKGRAELETQLTDVIQHIATGLAGSTYESIQGMMERTRRLIYDCQALLERAKVVRASPLAVRFAGGLGPLAIGYSDASASSLNPGQRLLLEEREQIKELIRSGVTLRMILAPRVSLTHTRRYLSLERQISRFKRLLDTFENNPDRLPLEYIQPSISEPFWVRNTYILGNGVLYDGIKGNMKGGYDLSIRLTDQAQIAARVEAFDSFFNDAVDYTFTEAGMGDGSRNISNLHTAFILYLRKLYDEFRAKA